MAKHAVIIGAGHNGLVCASYLADAGLDVTVLEQQSVAGGAAVTEEFHPGFRNSVASYTVSLLHPQIIDDLNLKRHGLEILERAVNNFLPLYDGSSLVSYPDPVKMQREVSRFSTRDAERLTPFWQELDVIVTLVKDLMLTLPPDLDQPGLKDVWQGLKLGLQFKRLSAVDKQRLLRLFSTSAGEMLDDNFETDALKALIGFDAIVGNYASPYQSGSAYVLLHHVIGEVNGKAGRWGHARGGMGAITQAMAREAESRGVSIELDSKVEKILTSHGRAHGVRLPSGETIEADIVVSNLNPKLLFLSLLDAADISSATRSHFKQYKCQSGSFRMNVALAELPAFTAEHPPEALTGGIIIAPSLGYMDRAYTDARQHGYSRQPIVEMLIPSLVDDGLAPTGQHVASLFCQQFDPGLGPEWDLQRDAAADTVINIVNAFAPNFKDSILGRQTLSPWDLEQRFGLIGGDIFHGRLTLDQLFSARPMVGAGQYATEIGGLYMCGSGTHPGGGVSGAPGHNAAQRIVADL